MTDDATLSDFASADSSSESADDGADSPTSGSPTDADRWARSTYAYGEYTCSNCGQSTDRVWRADGVFVCPDCKQW